MIKKRIELDLDNHFEVEKWEYLSSGIKIYKMYNACKKKKKTQNIESIVFVLYLIFIPKFSIRFLIFNNFFGNWVLSLEY